MKRIIIHWTAGTNKASSLDREHYHLLIEGDGKVVPGTRKPESNLNVSDGDYAAHTRALNTDSIGVALCGMHDAQGWPKMVPGKYPITEAQLKVLAIEVANLCETYNIPVKRETVLTHAEVEPTLKVTQRGKWDIRWLPGATKVLDPIEVGDEIRAMVEKELETPSKVEEIVTIKMKKSLYEQLKELLNG